MCLEWASLRNVIHSPFSAPTLLIGWHEGHPACKSWVLVCCWWRFDWSFACLIAPVVSTTSIILSSSKIQNGVMHSAARLARLYWKMTIKWVFVVVNHINLYMFSTCGVVNLVHTVEWPLETCKVNVAFMILYFLALGWCLSPDLGPWATNVCEA